MRSLDPFSMRPWWTWIDDPDTGTEIYVVDENTILSYRAPGRKFRDPARQRHYEEICVAVGIDPAREETGIVRRGAPAPLVLVGDHRRGLQNKSRSDVALYYESSEEKCPGSDDSWWERAPS